MLARPHGQTLEAGNVRFVDSAARPTAALLVATTAFLIGAILRLEPVPDSFLFGDELHSLADVQRGLEYVTSHFDSTGSGLALQQLQYGLLQWLPLNHWVIRAPAWAPGLLLIALCYPFFRRRIGPPAAAIATALLAVSPLLIFYSHFARAYALAVLLCAALLAVLEAVLAGRRATAPLLAALALCTAAAPWAHASTLVLVAPACLGALIALLSSRSRRSDALRVFFAIVVGALLCLLLHLPAWDSIANFASSKTSRSYYGRFDGLDVVTLLAGSGVGARIALAVVGASLVAWLAEERARGLSMALGCIGPALALSFVDLYGDAYAYARYALPAVVPASLVTGWAVARLFRGRSAIALAAGGALAAALFFSGPYGARRVDDGPYANTYLTMQPLPAFDVPYGDAPSFYAELAGRSSAEREQLRIIEVPALLTRSRQYYRNLYLQHGVETLLGAMPEEIHRVPKGPYADLSARGFEAGFDADYLILHLDPTKEVSAYWKFVYGPQVRDATSDSSLVAFMQRQQRFGGSSGKGQGRLVTRLREEFGTAAFNDGAIAVWKLR